MFFRRLLQASAILSFLCSTATAQNACNNSPSLCQKAYNNITHLGAHDSAFLRDQSTSFSTSGNQFYNTTVQLEAGVRMFSAQVHKTNASGSDAWRLCHTSCTLLDAGTLQSWLSEIKTWMDKNTNDVVTVLIVNSDNATPSELGAIFTSSGIDKLAYTPPTQSTVPETWPTLDRLIGNGTRLMSFVTPLGQASTEYPFLMDQYSFMFENSYDNTSPSNYSCNPDRPTNLNGSPAAALQSKRMFLMNHFLYDNSLFGIEITNVTYAATTNAETGFGSLGASVRNCTGVYGKPPSFVMVDWFNMGPAMASVDAANGVTDATGRKNVSTQALAQTTSGVGRQQGSVVAVVIALVAAVTLAS